MKKLSKWIGGLFSSKSNPSSKRFVGIISSVILWTVLLINCFTYREMTIDNNLIDAVLILALGGLGLTTIDHIAYRKKDAEEFKNPSKE